MFGWCVLSTMIRNAAPGGVRRGVTSRLASAGSCGRAKPGARKVSADSIQAILERDMIHPGRLHDRDRTPQQTQHGHVRHANARSKLGLGGQVRIEQRWANRAEKGRLSDFDVR